MSGSEKPQGRVHGPDRRRHRRSGHAALAGGRGGTHPIEGSAARGPQSGDDHGPEEASPPKDSRFISWADLERVADEAADIDSVVRTELERVGQRTRLYESRATDAGYARPTRRRRRARLVLLVVPAALVVLAARQMSIDRVAVPEPSPTAAAHTVAPHTVAPASEQPSSSATPSNVVTAIEARLSVSARCWVLATADGKTVFTGTLSDGARTFRAHRSLLIRLGNAGGARLVVNGRPVTTGSPNEVVDLSFAIRNGRLVQLPT